MPRREDHEVHKDMWGHWIKKKNSWTLVRETPTEEYKKQNITK